MIQQQNLVSQVGRPADSPTPDWDLEVIATRDIRQHWEIYICVILSVFASVCRSANAVNRMMQQQNLVLQVGFEAETCRQCYSRLGFGGHSHTGHSTR